MTKFSILAAMLLPLLSLDCPLSAQANSSNAESAAAKVDCELPEIRKELAKRVAEDQKARMQMLEANRKSITEDTRKSVLHDAVNRIDEENRAWLAERVEEHGWLGRTLVGDDGAHHAWLLVQHADRDREFQKKCLALMSAMPAKEVSPIDIAYLTDRVLAAESKPQRFGTQCIIKDGKAIVKEVEDPENLNQRRKELGLPPIEEYLKFVESMYAKPSTEDSKSDDAAKKDKERD